MTIDELGGKFAIWFEYDHRLVNEVRALPGRRWDKDQKIWFVPAKHAALVFKFGIDNGFTFTEAAARLCEKQEKLTPQLFSVPTPDLSAPFGDIRLFDHQKVAVARMLEKGRLILADDMGLGKTISAIVAALQYNMPIHVIAPVSLHENWQREFLRISRGGQLHLCSWAKLPKEIASPYVLIADEAHYAQAGHHSKRGAGFLALTENAAAVFLLTGTPMKNGRPINLMPLLQAVDHGIVANVRNFQKYYCAAHATQWSRWDTSGAAHLDELHHKTQDAILRRTKEECLDLPEKMRVMKEVDVDPQDLRLYEDQFKRIIQRYRNAKAENPMGAAIDAMTMMQALRQAASAAKIKGAVDVAREIIESGRKVVVFSMYVETVKHICDLLRLGGADAQILTGGVAIHERDSRINDFQNSTTKALVCTFGTGGLGITLTAAQDVILVERPWTPGDTVQAEDRLHRIGQKGTVTSYWLQWPYGNIDATVDTLLDAKEERVQLVMCGKRRTLRGAGYGVERQAAELVDAMAGA